MSFTANPPNTSNWRPPKPGGSQVRVPGGLIGSAGVEPSSTVFGDHPKPSGSQPQGISLADVLAMLKAVHKAGSHNYKAHVCHFCGKPASQDEHGDYWENHERGCQYLQVEDFLKEHGQL